MLNAAFIFIAPEADPETHRATGGQRNGRQGLHSN